MFFRIYNKFKMIEVSTISVVPGLVYPSCITFSPARPTE